jgi:hypothetical protein
MTVKPYTWSTPTLIEVPHDSPEFWEILGALTPEQRAIVKSPNIAANLSAGGKDGGLQIDERKVAPAQIDPTHKKRWLFAWGATFINRLRRPPRDRSGDPERMQILIAALRDASRDPELRQRLIGSRGKIASWQCQTYLNLRFPDHQWEIISAAVKTFKASLARE